MVRLSWIACLLATLCVSSNASAGWPFFSEDGLRRGTPEYYEAHAGDPPGSRQRYRYGKLWPVQARPVGPRQTCVHRYHTAHYWPYPYKCQDRSSIIAFYDAQVSNGWQSATTFYSYHFDEATNELNSSGRQHLSWLMTHVPVQHRQAYVVVTADASAHSTRILSVEKSIASAVGNQQAIPVLPRVADPLGRPAHEIQKIHEDSVKGALPPVITYTSATGGGGGG